MSPDALSITEREWSDSDNAPWSFPDGWGWAPLRPFLDGAGTSIDPRRQPHSKFVLYSVPAFDTRRPVQVLGREIGSAKRQVDPGSVLLCRINPRINRAWLVSKHDEYRDRVIASTEWVVFPPHSLLDPQYLRYFLSTERIRQYLSTNVSGVGGSLMRVSPYTVGAAAIPIAPLPEQRRIVARINELFAEIADGEAALERARQGLDIWRRALLKAAVTGELTRDWREANRPAETGADLLARILAQRGATSASRPRRRGGAAALPLDTSALPTLPEGWEWAKLDALGEIVGGVTVDKKRAPADPVEVPYLRVANVQRGYLDLMEIKTIRVERNVARRLELRPNDVLLNEGGDRDKIGRGWVWQDEIPVCIHQNHIFRVRLHDDGVDAQFVSHYANELGRRFFIEKGKQTTNLASISLSKISELPVPVPPPAEVQIIIERLREAFATDADNRRDLTEAQALSSAQRQSILKAAFEGRLAPQDPADEPASALLARLRDGHPGNGARRRRARAAADFWHPSLPGLSRQSVDPRVEPAGEQ
jgi:type I restriction enzyme S subunit